MIPTGEPAGTIATRTAGVVEFRATLAWGDPEDAPAGRCVPEPTPRSRHELKETLQGGGTKREISGRVMALTERDLGTAVEALARAVTVAAALSEAVLEARSVRLFRPRATPPDVLQALATDLWRAGFPVRFAPSWTPACGGEVAVGLRGLEEDLRGFLRAHPSWRLA